MHYVVVCVVVEYSPEKAESKEKDEELPIVCGTQLITLTP